VASSGTDAFGVAFAPRIGRVLMPARSLSRLLFVAHTSSKQLIPACEGRIGRADNGDSV
jgi:hypothetical protein